MCIAPAAAKGKCCWSKWGDKDNCGDYVGPDGKCNTEPTKACNSDGDCPDSPAPSPSPTPPSPPTPPTPTPPPRPGSGLPAKTMGLYLLIQDDTTPYTDTSTWTPELPAYMTQSGGPNVFWLAFLNPINMSIGPGMVEVSKNRPAGSLVIPSVGGYSYSMHPNPWPWLKSASAAEAMAQEVATWPKKYGFDGIDLDIESGAGDDPDAGANMMAFVRKLKSLVPKFVITQPVFGYPGVKEEEYVPNQSWEKGATAGIDAIGIMVYSGSGALNYVKNYVNATQQWNGFPITSDVPAESVILGAGGDAGTSDVEKLATAAHEQGLGGIMVWYASVNDKATGKPAIQYGHGTPDASSKDTTAMWSKALNIMRGKTDAIVV